MNNWRWGHCIVNQKWNTNEGSFSFYRDQKTQTRKLPMNTLVNQWPYLWDMTTSN